MFILLEDEVMKNGRKVLNIVDLNFWMIVEFKGGLWGIVRFNMKGFMKMDCLY